MTPARWVAASLPVGAALAWLVEPVLMVVPLLAVLYALADRGQL